MPTHATIQRLATGLTSLALIGVADASTNSRLQSSIEGLRASITIEWDEHAIPTITAGDSLDAHAALGWLHARDRFFQMDIARRQAAGELSAILGPMTLRMDREPAIARRRDLAQRILGQLPPDQRLTLEAYTRGVNAEVQSWNVAPIEYDMLNATPNLWRPEDCVLVLLSMFDQLQNTSNQELGVATLRDLVSDDATTWLLSNQSPWDAFLITPEATEDPTAIPQASREEGRSLEHASALAELLTDERIPGSNSFAVAGSRSNHGGAILANDPHLRYTAPGIWYRVALRWPSVEAVGLSLPGVPGLPIGATEELAWGLTNTTGDFEDLVIVQVDPQDPSRYQGPGGWEPFDARDVTIDVAGATPETVPSLFTRWGPIVQSTSIGDLALLRTMDQPGAVDFDILELYTATTVDEGLDIAARWGSPSQNVLVADADGRIGWTISGWIPDRRGYDGLSPVPHDADRGWFGALPESARPRVVDPPSGVLFTANNRLVPEPQASRIGRVWADPGRAWRIRELLAAQDSFDESDLFRIQHDEFIPRFVPYRDMLAEGLRSRRNLPGAPETLELILRWDGRASANSTAVPVVEAFRRSLLESAKPAIVARHLRPEARPDDIELAAAARAVREAPVLEVIQRGRATDLPPEHPGWETILDQAVDAAIVTQQETADVPWSERNRAVFRHALAGAHPLVGSKFDLPSAPQPGHWGAVRVQSGGFGASARLVAAPSRLTQGILTTPGGQSGDPRSKHYTDLHDDWATATPTPLLPGDMQRTIRIVPASD